MHTDLETLLDEVRLLWHVMNRAAEQLHRQEPVTPAMRGVLEFVRPHGPTTVPHISRSRHVTRQHIQVLVNVLLELQLVTLATNPAHRRSPLVRLTAKGQTVFDRMKRREDRLLSRLAVGRDPLEIRRSTKVLQRLRRALEENP